MRQKQHNSQSLPKYPRNWCVVCVLHLLFAELPDRQDVLAHQWVQQRWHLEMGHQSGSCLSLSWLRGQQPGQRRRVAVAITSDCWWEHDQLCRRQRQKQERRLINTAAIGQITKRKWQQLNPPPKWRKIRAKISSNIFQSDPLPFSCVFNRSIQFYY